MSSLKDKVAIITGAGRGIGKESALFLAKEGAKVLVNDLGANPDGSGEDKIADEVVEEITSLGGEALANYESVDSYEGGKNIFESALNEFGAVDILVNNAGILRDKTLFNMDESDWDAIMAVHLKGHFNCTQPFVRYIRETNRLNCKIINMSSVSGLIGNFGQTNYGAAKLGLVGFMNTLKLEGQKYNVHTNALTPVAYTRMTANLMPPEAENLLTPESVTPAAIYLVSENAPNGTILCAGAGVFSVSQIMESDGISLGLNATAEDIVDNWEEISNFENAKPYNMGGEQTGKVFEKAMETIEKS